MGRVKFGKGQQRKFILKVMENVLVSHANGLLQFGLDVKESTLRNYFNESRCLSEDLFNHLCQLGKIDKKEISFRVLEDNWGMVLGGKKGER